MRKIAILAAVVALAGAGTAQAQRGARPGRAGGEGRAEGRGEGRGGPGMMADRGLLKGITLTEAQKTKLEQVRGADRANMGGGRGAGRGNFEAIREAREKGDTATVRRLMQEQRAEMDARRDQQIAAIRAILTSDQLGQFDANVAEMKKREAEMGPGGRGGARGRGGRPPGSTR